MQCDPTFCLLSRAMKAQGGLADTAAGVCRHPESCFQIKLPANEFAVRSALRAAIARYVRQMTDDEAGLMEIVLAELMNNIVEHAYADSGMGEIALRITQGPEGLLFRVEDQGAAMPGGALPASHLPELSMAGGPEHLPEGGFGWFLIRDLTRDLRYVREGNTNRVQFCLPLSRA